MHTFYSYVIQSFLASGILTVYYWIALRNTGHHVFNRFYLLFALLAGQLLPLLDWERAAEVLNTQPLFVAGNYVADSGQGFAGVPARVFVMLYIAVGLALLAGLIIKIAGIYRIRKTFPVVRKAGYYFIETPIAQAPFVFLDNLFWRKDLAFNTAEADIILRHELVHLRQRHTLDKLFTHVSACICWINPFSWIIRRELGLVHEFLADAEAIRKGDLASFARMILQSAGREPTPIPHIRFFNRPSGAGWLWSPGLRRLAPAL